MVNLKIILLEKDSENTDTKLLMLVANNEVEKTVQKIQKTLNENECLSHSPGSGNITIESNLIGKPKFTLTDFCCKDFEEKIKEYLKGIQFTDK